MMNQEVRSIMTKNPEIATPSQTVEEISNFMVANHLQQLPVVDDGKLVGLVTSYDLWKRYETNHSIGHMKVSDVMNTNILKIGPKDKVGTAAELFADRRFKTLPVVNINNELKGVVTAFDLIRVAFVNEYENPILYKDQFNKK